MSRSRRALVAVFGHRPAPPTSAAAADAAWWIGLLYLTASILGTAAALLPPADVRPLAATGAATAIGFLLIHRRPQLAPRSISALLATAAVLITVGVWLGDDPTITVATAVLYYWLAWCVSVFCGRREVWWQVAWAAAGFVLLAWKTDVPEALAVELFVIAGMAGWVTANRYLLGNLERSNRRFATLVESLHEGLLIHDRTGAVVEMNPAAITTLDIARERMVGGRPSDILRLIGTDEQPIPPDEMPIAAVAATGQPVLHQIIGVDRGNFVQWLDVSVVPRVDQSGFVTMFHDATNVRVAAVLLAESEARFRSLAERAPIGIFTADRHGVVDFVNDAFCQISGLEHSTALASGWAEALGSANAGRLRRDWREMFSRSRSGTFELEVVGTDHTSRHLQIDAAMVADVDGAQRFVGTLTDVTDRHDLEQRLRREATHDPLTGVANRLLFSERLQHALQRQERAGGLVGILVVDLDRFKPVNDTFGHRVGDALLVEVAHRLCASVRLADTVARFGGDEFIVLLDTPVTSHEIDVIAQRILRLLGAPFDVDGSSVVIGASIGTAMVGNDDDRIAVDEVVALADRALYEAKALGGGTVVHATPTGSGWQARDDRADGLDVALAPTLSAVGVAAFDSANLPMLVLDPADGRILAANRAATAFYGWTAAELMAKRIGDINTLSAEDVRAEMDRAASNSRHFFEFRHRLADGSICDVDVFSGPAQVHHHKVLVSTIVDATSRRRETTRAARSLFAARLLLDHDRDASILLDANGLVLDASLGALELLGVERIVVLGSSWADALALAEQARAADLVERALTRLDRVPVRQRLTMRGNRLVDVALNRVEDTSRLLICTLSPVRSADTSTEGTSPHLDRFERFCLEAASAGHQLAVFAVSVGGVAEIRERRGSDAAEHVRERIVRAIAAELRLDGLVHVASDEADQLLVAVRGVHGVGGARQWGDRLAQLAMEASRGPDHDAATAGVRVGVSLVHELQFNAAVEQARAALASADPRTSPVAVRTVSSDTTRPLDTSRLADLRGALDRDEFVLHYQPIVELRTGTLVGYEALVRWQAPNGGLLPPSEFLPVAEANDLIGAIDAWVLLTATRAIAERRANGDDLHVAVNISAHGLRSDRLVAQVADVVRTAALAPGALVIELTESAVLNHHHWHPRAIDDLHHLGVRVAIDDFGTGYSTLANLEHIQPDIVKIDRQFTSTLSSARPRTIAAAIAGFAHQLGHDVVVEGVETVEQHQIVTDLGCRYGQGYLYGRPAPLPPVGHRDVPAAYVVTAGTTP